MKVKVISRSEEEYTKPRSQDVRVSHDPRDANHTTQGFRQALPRWSPRPAWLAVLQRWGMGYAAKAGYADGATTPRLSGWQAVGVREMY